MLELHGAAKVPHRNRELLSRMLKRRGVKHNVLNAKQHEREGHFDHDECVAQSSPRAADAIRRFDAFELVASAGKLDLDSTLATYWSDYPNKDVARKITIRQLLRHTSGIGGNIFAPPASGKRPTRRSQLSAKL